MINPVKSFLTHGPSLETARNLCFILLQKVDVSEPLLWFDYRKRSTPQSSNFWWPLRKVPLYNIQTT